MHQLLQQKVVLDEHQVQKAIVYLAEAINKRGLKSKSKPVVLHSVRVGMLLLQNGASQDSVVAGFLHDVLEDSHTTSQDLQDEFGERIAKIVEALSFDHGGDGYEQRLKSAIESHQKAVELGAEATCVRACDLMDNSSYYELAESQELKVYLHAKFVAFMDLAEDQLKNTPFWGLLQETYKQKVEPLV